jgi:rfaE bifunctional protein nucleotidyltransferase chain/domain
LGKVVSQEEIILQRREWKSAGKRVVFVAGCFDLLHPGHIRLLEEARSKGGVVTVGVLSDKSVETGWDRSFPGVKRPITPSEERAEVLAALAAVDFVFEIEGDSFGDLLRRFAPDVIVGGADESFATSPLVLAAKAAGIEVVRIPLEPGHSASRLIERISQLRSGNMGA